MATIVPFTTLRNATKWVQVDLGSSQSISKVVLCGCFDNFANIGAGFGFPVRFKVEACNNADFKTDVTTIKDNTAADFPNPGTLPVAFNTKPIKARYVRITANKLAKRSNDYILALAELRVLNSENKNIALRAKVKSLDSIQAPVRWSRKNLVDGYYVGSQKKNAQQQVAKLNQEKADLLASILTKPLKKKFVNAEKSLKEVNVQLAAIPKRNMVYAAATKFKPAGNFRPTNGKPRPIHVLKRGKSISTTETRLCWNRTVHSFTAIGI